MTVGQWFDYWLEHSRLRSSTVHVYRGHVVNYLAPQLGELPVATLSIADVQTAFRAIGGNVGIRGARLSPSTVARIRSTLSSALTAAVHHQVIAHNPARGPEIQLPTTHKPKPVVWTDARVAHWRATGDLPGPVCVWTREQTLQFLHAIADTRRYPYYHLIAVTGLRRAEAAALRVTDVDLRHNELFVTPHPGHHTNDGELKSPASTRTIALDHVTANLLRRHIAARRDMPPAKDGHRYLFTTPAGQPYGLSGLTHEFKELLHQHTNLPPIRLHDLRHGAASLSLAAGNDLKDIQDLLGHSSLYFTADYYVSIYPDRRRHAAERTGTSLFATPPHPHTTATLRLHSRHVAGRNAATHSNHRTPPADTKSSGNTRTQRPAIAVTR